MHNEINAFVNSCFAYDLGFKSVLAIFKLRSYQLCAITIIPDASNIPSFIKFGENNSNTIQIEKIKDDMQNTETRDVTKILLFSCLATAGNNRARPIFIH